MARGPLTAKPEEPGWWIASDGMWYPPESAHVPPRVDGIHCRHCGHGIAPQAVVCVTCGCIPTSGNQFCRSCGAATNTSAVVCLQCGVSLHGTSPNTNGVAPTSSGSFPWWVATPTGHTGNKSKVAAGLLGLFLGPLGAHRFYLGYTNVGVAYLLIGLFGWILVLPSIALLIVVLIESIMLLTGSFNTDAQGNYLIN